MTRKIIGAGIRLCEGDTPDSAASSRLVYITSHYSLVVML